jgi:pimeloyl-ACP methyl ester carboxylesterase
LEIARPAFTVFSLYRSIKGDFSVHLSVEGGPLHFQSGKLNIAGTLLGIDSNPNSQQPAVLIVHGSTPQGRRLGLYRLLMQKLAERGFVVMAIDLRGFGQSDDPPDLVDPKSFDFVEDVASAYHYLERMPEIDPERIFLVGHSFGADVALSTVARSGYGFKKIALIGPGRRFIERAGRPDAVEFEYFQRRDMRYMGLDEPIPTGVYIRYRPGIAIENHSQYLSEKTHIPIFLVDCELEGQEEHHFLRNIFQAIRGEKAYFTIPGADHYINTANIGPVVFYDAKPMSLLVDKLSDFFMMPKIG